MPIPLSAIKRDSMCMPICYRGTGYQRNSLIGLKVRIFQRRELDVMGVSNVGCYEHSPRICRLDFRSSDGNGMGV